MAANSPTSVKDPNTNTQKEWFDIFIQKVTEIIHRQTGKSKPGDVTKELAKWFNRLVEEVYVDASMEAQERFKKAFDQTKVGLDYLSKITENRVNVLKVAMHAAPDKIYIWAEINDDDKKTDDELIKIEEEINAIYCENDDTSIQTAIVKKGENLPIPVHYKQVR